MALPINIKTLLSGNVVEWARIEFKETWKPETSLKTITAFANAVYHKGYDVREPIEVRVENDQIEIISHPGPDRSVTIDGLKKYKVTNRRYRNRRIGEFLKELHLTEGRNTGFKKILNALENNGSPKPEFETDEEHTYFISRFFVREGFYDKIPENEFVKTTEKTTEKLRKKLTIRKKFFRL